MTLCNVFENVLPHSTSSSDIALLKKFRKYWNKIDTMNISFEIDNIGCDFALENV